MQSSKLLEDTQTKIKELETRIENKEFSKWGGDDYAQQRLKSLKQKEVVLSRDAAEIDAGKAELKNLWTKLNKIEAKEKCLRVQFLDWFSDKLLSWSYKVQVMSNKIDSPCIIEVAPRKKEQSKAANFDKELSRLQKLNEMFSEKK